MRRLPISFLPSKGNPAGAPLQVCATAFRVAPLSRPTRAVFCRKFFLRSLNSLQDKLWLAQHILSSALLSQRSSWAGDEARPPHTSRTQTSLFLDVWNTFSFGWAGLRGAEMLTMLCWPWLLAIVIRSVNHVLFIVVVLFQLEKSTF